MASVSTPMTREFVDTVNKFGFQLQALAVENESPSGLCPLNIYHCLSMVAAGSKDKNLKAFGQVMGFNVDKPEPSALKEQLAQVVRLDSYSKGNTAVDFSSANSIWHSTDFMPNAPWLSTMKDTFQATVEPLALDPMNAFIERETRGKFKDLIKPDDLIGAVLYLVSCLYFKAKWQNPFEKLSTEQKAGFFTWDGKTQAVKMMNKVERLEYVEDKEKQVCILPYKTDDNPAGPRWKAAIVLPKRKGLSAMQDILKNFAASPGTLRSLLMGDNSSSVPHLSSVMQKLIPQKRPQPVQGSSGTSTLPSRSQKIHLSLPSFSLKLNLDLIPPLQKLGLGPAFKLSDDFAPISKEQLLITRATHDLFLEVNEEGTEMAAVTTIGMSRSRQVIQEMRVDRPFLFIVFDAVSGLVLCGAVVNSIPSS